MAPVGRNQSQQVAAPPQIRPPMTMGPPPPRMMGLLTFRYRYSNYQLLLIEERQISYNSIVELKIDHIFDEFKIYKFFFIHLMVFAFYIFYSTF